LVEPDQGRGSVGRLTANPATHAAELHESVTFRRKAG